MEAGIRCRAFVVGALVAAAIVVGAPPSASADMEGIEEGHLALGWMPDVASRLGELRAGLEQARRDEDARSAGGDSWWPRAAAMPASRRLP